MGCYIMDNPVNEIKKILDDNQVRDLKRFLTKRERLNMINSFLVYLFHLIMSCGIFISSFGAGMNDQRLIWIGVGLSLLASLVQVYEKLNDNQLKKLLNDIMTIKNGNYVDESAIINIDHDNEHENNIDANRHIQQTIPLINQSNNDINKIRQSSMVLSPSNNYIIDHQTLPL